jgi:hypothetical protein
MSFDDMETEFFGANRRSSRPKRSDRLRAKREQRRQLQPLKSTDPGERAGAAASMIEQGVDSSAVVLLDFVRDEPNRDVRRTVAQAVLTAPIGAHPDRSEAQLRDWALAEVARHGDQPPAPASSPPSQPPPSPAPPPPPIVGGNIPAALSADDRWRTGEAELVRLRWAPPTTAPASRPIPPPPPAAPTPPVVGGTVGNGSKPNAVAPTPTVSKPAPSVDVPDRAPDRPATWRVVKAHPVDIVVWECTDSEGETAEGEPETAQLSRSPIR